MCRDTTALHASWIHQVNSGKKCIFLESFFPWKLVNKKGVLHVMFRVYSQSIKPVHFLPWHQITGDQQAVCIIACYMQSEGQFVMTTCHMWYNRWNVMTVCYLQWECDATIWLCICLVELRNAWLRQRHWHWPWVQAWGMWGLLLHHPFQPGCNFFSCYCT